MRILIATMLLGLCAGCDHEPLPDFEQRVGLKELELRVKLPPGASKIHDIDNGWASFELIGSDMVTRRFLHKYHGTTRWNPADAERLVEYEARETGEAR